MNPSGTHPWWSNQDITLYHGTLLEHTGSILQKINLNKCKDITDFGKGFYTTTVLSHAVFWANATVTALTSGQPAVVRFTVSRNALAELESLWFVIWNYADDFWSFIEHCRGGLSFDHGRAVHNNGWYDIVVGPVTDVRLPRMVLRDHDQISFHTERAIKVLNDQSHKSIIRV
jgi:hypothetical protein